MSLGDGQGCVEPADDDIRAAEAQVAQARASIDMVREAAAKHGIELKPPRQTVALEDVQIVYDDLLRITAERNRLREALEWIAEQQPNTLKTLGKHGIVFDEIGADPKNWQHVAFSIYTDLCEIDSVARTALTG